MSAPKHTPGPWVKMSDIPEYDWVVSNSEGASPGDIVCAAPLTDCPESLSNWPANRALICAAPDMLEALRDILEAVELCTPDAPEPVAESVIAHARAAIAKAEGQP